MVLILIILMLCMFCCDVFPHLTTCREGISYCPVPVKSVMSLSSDDWMTDLAKPLWSASGRGDLQVMHSLGANSVAGQNLNQPAAVTSTSTILFGPESCRIGRNLRCDFTATIQSYSMASSWMKLRRTTFRSFLGWVPRPLGCRLPIGLVVCSGDFPYTQDPDQKLGETIAGVFIVHDFQVLFRRCSVFGRGLSLILVTVKDVVAAQELCGHAVQLLLTGEKTIRAESQERLLEERSASWLKSTTQHVSRKSHQGARYNFFVMRFVLSIGYLTRRLWERQQDYARLKNKCDVMWYHKYMRMGRHVSGITRHCPISFWSTSRILKCQRPLTQFSRSDFRSDTKWEKGRLLPFKGSKVYNLLVSWLQPV